MKHLPKHLRPRYRYLAVGIETDPDAALDRRSFQRALWFAARDLLGDPGSATVDLSVRSFRYRDGTGESVVRTRREAVEDARAAVACVSAVEEEPVGLRVRGIAGTVRSCEEKYMGRAPIATEQRELAFGGSLRSATVRDGRIEVRTGETTTGATTLDFE